MTVRYIVASVFLRSLCIAAAFNLFSMQGEHGFGDVALKVLFMCLTALSWHFISIVEHLYAEGNL